MPTSSLPNLTVAPLVAYSDRCFRAVARCFGKQVGLYTEMIVTRSLPYIPDAEKFYAHQVSGFQTAQITAGTAKDIDMAVALAAKHGYGEVNLNFGCPSKRAINGDYGLVNLSQPAIMQQAMKDLATACQAHGVISSAKLRLGVGSDFDRSAFYQLIESTLNAGCDAMVVHARMGLLTGISTRKNRSIPSLMPHEVYLAKQAFPTARITYNGGIKTADQAMAVLGWCDSVMIGRGVMNDMALVGQLQTQIIEQQPGNFFLLPQAKASLDALKALLLQADESNEKLWDYTRHLATMAKGFPQASTIRALLSQHQVSLAQAIPAIELVFEERKVIDRYSQPLLDQPNFGPDFKDQSKKTK